MSYLKKPFTPVVFTSASKTFNVYGKSFFKITNVYLSGNPYENQTFYSPFSGSPKLSATYPGFFGIKLLSSAYITNNINTITFTIPPATRAGFVDIIIENPAGYGTLTQYVVKDLYTEEQTQLELRPWSLGVKVLTGVEMSQQIFDYQIYTITGDLLITINGDNIFEIY
jgi:hypothetical protein